MELRSRSADDNLVLKADLGMLNERSQPVEFIVAKDMSRKAVAGTELRRD